MRSSRRSSIAALALIAVAAPAVAQPSSAPGATAPLDAHKRSQAKSLVDAGLAAHDRGEYDKAIALYEQAFALVPHPALYFNMAQSHRLAGRIEPAIAMYRKYLLAVTTGPLAEQARAWIATLEQRRAAAAALPHTTPAPIVKTIVVAPPPTGDQRLRIAGYASGGAAAIALGTGVYFGVRARKISDELSAPGAPFDPARYDAGRTAQRRMIVSYGVGGALAVAGTILYLLGRGDDGDSTVAPVVGGDQVGVSWSGSF